MGGEVWPRKPVVPRCRVANDLPLVQIGRYSKAADLETACDLCYPCRRWKAIVRTGVSGEQQVSPISRAPRHPCRNPGFASLRSGRNDAQRIPGSRSLACCGILRASGGWVQEAQSGAHTTVTGQEWVALGALGVVCEVPSQAAER